MAKVILKKKIDPSTGTLSDVKSYARKIWLAGLGAYTKVGQEGSEYFQRPRRSSTRQGREGV